MSIFKKAMDYLGLGPDDAYDDYDMAPEPEPRQARARQPRYDEPVARGSRASNEYEADTTVRTVPARPSFPSRDVEPVSRRPMPATDDSSVHPRPSNPSRSPAPTRGGSSMSSDPYTVRPRRFDSAQEIADKFKEVQPVIMNLEATERDVSRRLIDFASGLCYGLNGSMEKVASGVYLLKPAGARSSHYPGDGLD
jgi:cell division inhibitor SepF